MIKPVLFVTIIPHYILTTFTSRHDDFGPIHLTYVAQRNVHFSSTLSTSAPEPRDLYCSVATHAIVPKRFQGTIGVEYVLHDTNGHHDHVMRYRRKEGA